MAEFLSDVPTPIYKDEGTRRTPWNQFRDYDDAVAYHQHRPRMRFGPDGKG